MQKIKEIWVQGFSGIAIKRIVGLLGSILECRMNNHHHPQPKYLKAFPENVEKRLSRQKKKGRERELQREKKGKKKPIKEL